MKLRSFANPRFLEQIGRGMLAQLLDQFAPEFATHGVALPGAALDDEAYYSEVARLAPVPEVGKDHYVIRNWRGIEKKYTRVKANG